MNFLSVCSGIEAASVAWNPLGWHAVGFSEIEPFPCRVLAHHFPNTPNLGDLTLHAEWNLEPGCADILVGGTPCQSFSVAGLRGGMDDERGQLALVYLALARRLRPRWVVWENVPGVLSADSGRAFGSFLGGLAELGYGWAYRVLDAQYAGLAQRRKRVFVVGCLGDWRGAAAVLLERASLRGDPAPSRAAGKGTAHPVAPCLAASGRGFERAGDTRGQDAVVAHALRGEGFDASEDGTGRVTPLVAMTLTGGSNPNSNAAGRRREDDFNLVSRTLNGHHGRSDGESETLIAATVAGTLGQSSSSGRSYGSSPITDSLVAFGWQNSSHQGDSAHEHHTPTLDKSKVPAVAFNLRGRDGGAMPEECDAASLRAASGGSSRSYVATASVRRLTPRECERLQGFPDDYTAIPGAKDSPRYTALGNSIAVPVLRWIGERIAQVELA